MLPKKNRLTKKDFKNVFGKRVFHTPFFTVHFAPNINTPNYKCSIVVTKKHTKKSIERNYLRRYYYAAIKEVLINNKIPSSYFIFFVKQKPDFVILTKSLGSFFNNIPSINR